MKFNFSFGKKRKTIFDWAKISIILETLIEILSKVLKIDKKNLWNIVDEIQREFLKRGWIDDTINEYIINTPDLLEQRIVRDVDNAIVEYEKLEEKQPVNMKNETILEEIGGGKYTETQQTILKQAEFYEKESDGSKAQDILGGEMDIKSPWVK
jgi:hypothetical protein